MTLSAGIRLGPCVVLAPLGAGGMREIYRARDTRLGPILPGVHDEPLCVKRREGGRVFGLRL